MMEKARVVIARDRESAGGGIHNYYNSIQKYLDCKYMFVDVGKPQGFYGKLNYFNQLIAKSSILRLLSEWLDLTCKTVRSNAELVHVNPGLDAHKMRAIKREAVSILIGKLLGRKILVFWRGWDSGWIGKPQFPSGNKGLLCRIFKLASAHIVLSSEFKRDLRKWGFQTPIYLETTVAADEVVKDAFKAKHVDSKNINLLFLSRIESRKGVFDLLEAFTILRRTNPAYTLTFAGDGPDLDALRKRSGGIEGVFFTGYVSGEAKNECYLNASIFCFLSSYGEGMPNAVLEGLAMGLPIISSTAGGLRDVLEDGLNGFIIPQITDEDSEIKFDPELTADRIAEIVADPERYSEISKENIALAKAKFVSSIVAQRLQDIYHKTINNRRNPAKQLLRPRTISLV